MSKTFECPHCKKGFLIKDWDEVKKHIESCSDQYQDPKKRFDKEKKERSKKPN